MAVACTIGTASLNPVNSAKTFYYDKVTDPNNHVYRILNTVNSFYPTTQTGKKLVDTNLDAQGYAVALSADGSTLAVGGFNSNSTGGADIYTRSGLTAWTQQGSFIAATGTSGNNTAFLAVSVALSSDGNTLAIGFPFDTYSATFAEGVGATWVFTRSAGVWTQQSPKLVGTGITSTYAQQGYSVALSDDGNTLAVGGPVDNGGIGATWIFTRSGTSWSQQGAKLLGTGGSTTPEQGWSVALSADGNTLAIGANYDNNGIGAVWIFTRSGTVWSQQGPKLIGSGYITNGGLVNQGNSVSLSSDGNTLAEGGINDNAAVGATWVFTRSANVWSQQGNKIVGTGNTGGSEQGSSVALSADGNTLAIGAQTDNSSTGATWIFIREGTNWYQQGKKLLGTGGTGPGALQGYAVALSADANTMAVGAYGDNSDVGATWIFN